MRTSTIYRALDCVREASVFFATERRVRQAGAFERELLRRMDERDILKAKADAWDVYQEWCKTRPATEESLRLGRKFHNAAERVREVCK